MLWAGYLFNLDDHNGFVPELATEMPTLRNGDISRDGLTILYHLRRGTLAGRRRVHGRRRLVHLPRDHERSQQHSQPRRLRRHRVAGRARPAHGRRAAEAAVVAVRRDVLHDVGTPFAVLPKHLLEKYPDINRIPYNSKPVGTGPFIMDGWQRGQKIVFHANPHYWRGRPKLDRIEYDPSPTRHRPDAAPGA